MNLVVDFQQSELGRVALVGGKGGNLIALTAAGFPVPPGFIVTAEAYEQFLAAAPDLDATFAAFDYDHPSILITQCERLRKMLSQMPLPEAVRQVVRAGLQRLGATEQDPFAVRSSSTFEDLAQAAFAGQHDTYLNIRGLDAIGERIRDCFVSLWMDRAVLYRHHQGFSQREARMAVVVQRQIASEVAGVGFSINPVSGRLDRMVLEANYGLGESVVAGGCEVDHFELDKKTLQIVERSIGHKDSMLVPTTDGVEERAVEPERRDQPCLSDEQLIEIARLLQRVESHYGWPQDIEWAWQAGRLYQLQSRPVTTLPPRWTRDESAERFPRPMTPLTWDLFEPAFRQSAAHSLALMGLPPLQADWFQYFHCHVYGNQNAVDLVGSFRPLRARSPQELAGELPELRRRYAWVLDLPIAWARDLDRYLIRLGRLSARRLDNAGPREIWAHLQEVLKVAVEYFRPNLAITTTGAFLHRLLHGLAAMMLGPERALPVIDGLLAGCETKTVQVNRELHELACLAKRTPALQQALRNQGGRAVWERGELAGFADFDARFQRFLEDHGHREMDMDHYHPTWSGHPWIVLDAVALILRNDSAEEPFEIARRQRQRYAEAEHQFVAAIPQELRFFFRELIRLARTYTTLDDLEHYQTTRLNPVCRQLVCALGEWLQKQGILDRPEDAFFLRKEELEEWIAADGNVSQEVYRHKVQESKQKYEASAQQPPPWSLEESAATDCGQSVQMLHGLPGSPGCVTGPCFLVRTPDDFARFPRQAILVAPTTNPAWTPLFYSAVGLITESGGPLSHGAVTAREMRLPAVMSVRGVMGRLCDGQVVTVDGTKGVVHFSEPEA
jgi:phosphohistidine swiveling domain-containing protein